jgi:hypothetical protein
MGTDVPDHELWASAKLDAELIRVTGDHFFAQVDRSFTYPFTTSRVVFSDADTVWLRRIDDVLTGVSNNGVAGFVAHKAPPGTFREEPNAAWDDIGRSLLGVGIPLGYRSTISGALVPFYLNYGFVVGAAEFFSRNAVEYVELAKRVFAYTGCDMGYQIALTLLMYRDGCDMRELDASYNFANDRHFANPELNDVSGVRVIHYLRQTFDRDNAFSDGSAYRKFLVQELGLVDSMVRARAFSLWGYTPRHI